MKASTDPKDQQTYLKARFLFHQRFGMPFACFAFALMAMVFGIQDERRGQEPRLSSIQSCDRFGLCSDHVLQISL